MYGQEVYYMPRKYLGTDSIMRENILSKFDDAYPLEAYVANVDGFQGSGDLMTKFGIRVTDESTFVISILIMFLRPDAVAQHVVQCTWP